MLRTGVLFQKKVGKVENSSRYIPESPRVNQAAQMKSINEGEYQAEKEAIREEKVQNEKFDQLVSRGTKVLYKLKTVWPFDFFPNTVTIDSEKLTVKFREFYFSSEIRSVYLKDITQIYVDSGPLFATMIISDQFTMASNTTRIRIPYLKKNEAQKARRIVEGLIIAYKQHINIENLKDNNLVEKLEDLGRMR